MGDKRRRLDAEFREGAVRVVKKTGTRRESEREKQYTAAKNAAACRALSVTQSIGRIGCALDNAAAETFTSTSKVEFAHRQAFKTKAEACIKISTWTADFHNIRSRHTANDGLAPISFERQTAQKRRAITAQPKAEVA